MIQNTKIRGGAEQSHTAYHMDLFFQNGTIQLVYLCADMNMSILMCPRPCGQNSPAGPP